MASKHILHEVTGCQNCPFAIRRTAFCALRKPPLDIRAALVIGDETTTPDQCPLRAGAHLFKLLQEKPAAKRGRPLPASTPGRDIQAEGTYFLGWLAGFSNCGLWEPITRFCEDYPPLNRYGPVLKFNHFYAAMSGRRPFYEAELDKVVAYAKAEMQYPGYVPAP